MDFLGLEISSNYKIPLYTNGHTNYIEITM